MPVTVKKKTVKTVRAKAPTQAKKVGVDDGAEEAPKAKAAPQAIPSGKKEGTSPTMGAVFAIFVFIMFAVVITLQIMEWKYYEAPIGVSQRSVWPMFVPPEGTMLPSGEGEGGEFGEGGDFGAEGFGEDFGPEGGDLGGEDGAAEGAADGGGEAADDGGGGVDDLSL